MHPGFVGHPVAVLLRHLTDEVLNLCSCPRPAGSAMAAAIILLRNQLWCQRSSVSGVTIVANLARTFRPSLFALAANRRRWSSVSRKRLSPSCSPRTRFSSRKYSII